MVFHAHCSYQYLVNILLVTNCVCSFRKKLYRDVHKLNNTKGRRRRGGGEEFFSLFEKRCFGGRMGEGEVISICILWNNFHYVSLTGTNTLRNIWTAPWRLSKYKKLQTIRDGAVPCLPRTIPLQCLLIFF